MAQSADNIIKFPGETTAQVETAAATWLARLTSGSLTLGDLAEFEYWRAASADHDRVYRELEAMWSDLGRVQASPGLGGRLIAGLRRYRTAPASRWGTAAGRIAAAMLAMMTGYGYLSTWRYDYHSGAGEIRRVTLADGSVASLKGDTAFDFRVSDSGARTVELARGEVFFEVVHDAARPFLVDVGSCLVRDVGTGFSVARTGRSATVSVDHGVVEVQAGGQSEVLTKGQQVGFGLYEMGRKTRVDRAAIASWRRGLYVAENKPLGEVLADLDEYYPGRILVTSARLRGIRINTVVQLGRLDAWFAALNDTKGVSVRHWGPVTLVGDRPT